MREHNPYFTGRLQYLCPLFLSLFLASPFPCSLMTTTRTLPLTLSVFLGKENRRFKIIPKVLERLIADYFKQLMHYHSHFLLLKEFDFRNDFGHNSFSYSPSADVRTPYLAICHDFLKEPPSSDTFSFIVSEYFIDTDFLIADEDDTISRPFFWAKDERRHCHFRVYFENHPGDFRKVKSKNKISLLCDHCRAILSVDSLGSSVIVCPTCFPDVVAFIRFLFVIFFRICSFVFLCCKYNTRWMAWA